ncbi:MAG: AAA family ATPase [archaeon]|nr:AAA family ATPase [archaeon]
MDREVLKSVCVKAAEDLHAYGRSGEGINEVVTDVVSYAPAASGHLLLTLENAVEDTAGLYLIVDGLVMDPGMFSFPFYDKGTRTLAADLPEGLRSTILHRRSRLQVAADLSFLVRKAADYYREYGDLIEMPRRTPCFPDGSYRFPAGVTPTEQQREAVRVILNSPMSYVWGAPGTGKTQMVLSTAIAAYMAAGRRVAVVAPTNNSLEQVLRGVVKVVSGDPEFRRHINPDRDILRVGSATEEFMSEFPALCETRCVGDMVERKRKEMDTLQKVLSGRSSGRFRSDLLLMKRYMQGLANADRSTARTLESKIRGLQASLRTMAASNPDLEECISGGISDPGQVDVALRMLNSCAHPAADIPRYAGMTREELEQECRDIAACVEALEATRGGASFETARIIACTPQMYMMRFAPNGHGGEKPAIDVDHIFVDEAGYCGLMNALGLFANGVPVTFLGDHKQLPPVCQIDNEELRSFIGRGGFMEYAFLWSHSALYCESCLSGTVSGMERDFLDDADPVFIRTRCADLTESHRFGTNLAHILDRYVYRNGITGNDSRRLEIECIDVTCPPRKVRENRPEALAIREYIEREKLVPGSFCILTPYKHQIRVLRDVMPEFAEDGIITVHRSQGREWDTVILSVQDGEGIDREVPLRFTSSKTDTGMKVINTAVSRAKRRLVVVCDRRYWSSLSDELVSGLVSDENCEKVWKAGENP